MHCTTSVVTASIAHTKMFQIIGLSAVRHFSSFKRVIESDPVKEWSTNYNEPNVHPFLVVIKRALVSANVTDHEFGMWEEELQKAFINSNYLGLPYNSVQNHPGAMVDPRNLASQMNEVASHTQMNSREIMMMKNVQEQQNHKIGSLTHELQQTRREFVALRKEIATSNQINSTLVSLVASLVGHNVNGAQGNVCPNSEVVRNSINQLYHHINNSTSNESTNSTITHQCPPMQQLLHSWAYVSHKFQNAITLENKLKVWFEESAKRVYDKLPTKKEYATTITNYRRIIKVSLFLSGITVQEHEELCSGPYYSDLEKQNKWETLLRDVITKTLSGVRSLIQKKNATLELTDSQLPSWIRKIKDSEIGDDVALRNWRSNLF